MNAKFDEAEKLAEETGGAARDNSEKLKKMQEMFKQIFKTFEHNINNV